MKIYKKVIQFLLFISCVGCNDIFEKDISDKAVDLFAPGDSVVTNNTSVTFWWGFVSGADYFNIQVVSPGFDNPQKVWIDSLVTENRFETELNFGNFQWRVYAMNNSSYAGSYDYTFSIIDTSVNNNSNNEIDVDSVRLNSPPNNFTYFADSSGYKSITFWWEKVKGADSYAIQIVKPDFTRIEYLIKDSLLETNKCKINMYPDNYQWKVTAFNTETEIASDIYNLSLTDTIKRIEDSVQIVTPKNNSYLSVQDITLRWKELKYDATYQIRIMKDDWNTGSLVSSLSSNIDSIKLNLNDGTYVIGVKAVGTKHYTDYSLLKINIDTQSPVIPELVSPSANDSLTTKPVLIAWTKNSDTGTTVKDQVQISYSETFNSFLMDSVVNYTNLLFQPEMDTMYYVRVKSIDLAGNESDFSTIVNFVFNEK